MNEVKWCWDDTAAMAKCQEIKQLTNQQEAKEQEWKQLQLPKRSKESMQF
jgi:hypothetical protein